MITTDMSLLKRIFSSWIAASLLTLILLLFAYRAISLAQKSYRTDADISKLNSDLAEVTEKRQQLQSMRDLLASDFFAENEARTKFGLRKAGEMVAVVPSSDTAQAKVENENVEDSLQELSQVQQEIRNTQEPIKNNIRWREYFFGASSHQSRPRDLNP